MAAILCLGCLCFLSLLMIWFIIHDNNAEQLISTKKKEKCSLYGEGLVRLCKFESVDAISPFVWSHRGFLASDQKLVDASNAVLDYFWKENILRFDVDISLQPNSNELIVSHPSQLRSYTKEFPSLQSMLSHLSTFRASNRFVTLEPKFEHVQHMESLIKTVQNSYISQQTAIIVSSPTALKELGMVSQHLSFIPNIAVAFRSQPKTSTDFRWLTERIERQDNKGRCEFEFRRLANHSKSVQVNMPDIALLLNR